MTPSVTIAEKIAQAFSVTVDYLLSGDTAATTTSVETGSYDHYLHLIEGMSEEDKAHTLAIMEAFALKSKLKPLSGK
jgi:transcriptional regulator with XRE-family HTH domain